MLKILTALLQVAFIVLKLTNYIDWSWWIVLAPIIIYLLFQFAAIFVVAVIELNKEKEELKSRGGKSKWEQKLEDIQKVQSERTKNTNK